MLYNDLSLPVCQFIFCFRIFQGPCRMMKPVQPVRIFLIHIMPVIQKIIMEQGSSYQIPAAVFNPQKFRKRHAQPCDLNTVLFYGNPAMLHIIFTAVKVFGMKNIPGILIQLILDLFLFSKIFYTLLPPAFPQICSNISHFISLSSDTLFLSMVSMYLL